MSTQERDPIFESLDRLAGLADADLVGDRMPGIQRRVRVARRRRRAGLVAAAAVVAVGGAGVWQTLPSDHTPPTVTTPAPAPWQRIDLDARPQGAGHVRISFTVTGESTAYADMSTGDPTDYAGPRSTEVVVDGAAVTGSDGGAISCEPGGDLTPYTMRFYADEPLVLPVSPGEHTIVVRAPYCADGKVVRSTQRVVVSTTSGGFATFDQRKADLDGDGTDEVLRLQVPKGDGEDQLVQVTWGTGETTTATIPNTMETYFRDPVDLDGDGDLELVLEGGGGDMAEGMVFLADTDHLERVKTVDADGKQLPLRSYADPTTWQTYLGADGIYSYRLKDPAATQFPAPVEVREWSLAGDTLTRSPTSVTRCVSFQPTTELGPC